MNIVNDLGIDIKLLIPLIVISLLLMITALIHCVRAQATRGPKWIWILIIICISMFGPVLYFVIGRKEQ